MKKSWIERHRIHTIFQGPYKNDPWILCLVFIICCLSAALYSEHKKYLVQKSISKELESMIDSSGDDYTNQYPMISSMTSTCVSRKYDYPDYCILKVYELGSKRERLISIITAQKYPLGTTGQKWIKLEKKEFDIEADLWKKLGGNK